MTEATLTQRQRQIVEAAMDILADQGIEAMTIKNIAERVGFRDAAVYRHFSSKNEILAAIAGEFAASSRAVLASIRRTDLDPLEKIKAFFHDRLELFARDRIAVTVMFSEELFRGNRSLQEQVDAVIAEHQRLLLSELQEGQRRGTLPLVPAEHLFMMIMGPLRLLVSRWRADECRFDLPAAGRALWQSLASVIAVDAPLGG